MKPPLQRLKTLNVLSVTKDHCNNLHAQNLKNQYILFVAVYYQLVLNGKLKLDLQPVLLDRPFCQYISLNKKAKKHKLLRPRTKYHLKIFYVSHKNALNIKCDYGLQRSKDIKH